MHRRIGGAGKAHIDDARAIGCRPVEALEDAEGIALGTGSGRVEGADGENLRARRRALQLAVRRDQSGDGGAVLVRRRRCIECVVALHDRAGQFRMRGVDPGIDHRHQYLVAAGERMCLRQPQLGKFILRVIAFRLDGGLLQRE